jgi:hypothetical protein
VIRLAHALGSASGPSVHARRYLGTRAGCGASICEQAIEFFQSATNIALAVADIQRKEISWAMEIACQTEVRRQLWRKI